MDEVLTLIGNEISRSKLLTPGGVVLTGGTSLLDGLIELSEKSFPFPVRVGYPTPLKGLTDRIKGNNLFEQVLKRMKDWFRDYF